jgi:hypothetical protein
MPAERDTVTFDNGAPAELFMAKRKARHDTRWAIAALPPQRGDSFRSRGISRCACAWRLHARSAMNASMATTFNVFTKEMINHCDGVCQIDLRHDVV